MKQITIQDFSLVKEGNTNGKEWALYQVVDSEGKKYSTFGSVLSVANVKNGESYMVSTETRKNGKFTNISIKEIYKANGEEKPLKQANSANNSTSSVKFDELMGVLHELQSQLLGVDNKLDQLLKQNEPDNK